MYEYISLLLDWCKWNIFLINDHKVLYFKEGQIWWCSIGINIGEEELGKGPKFERPVLIFKKFTANSFLGLPLAGHEKEGNWYVPCLINERKSSVMLNQARIFDKKRLRRRVMEMTSDDLEIITTKFRALYCPQKLITPPLAGETGIDGESQIVP